MNILQIISNLSLGGAEVLVVKTSILLKKMGCNVTILTFARCNNHLTKLAQRNGIEVVVVPKKIPVVNCYYSPYNIIFVANYIKKHKFDVIHAHLAPAQVCMAFVRFIYKSKIPLITTEHNIHNRRRKVFFKLFDHFLYSQFDRIAAVTEAVKDSLEAWVPSIKGNCKIIYNGVDVDEFSRVKDRGEEFQKKSTLTVLSIGRFHVQKGHDILLRAFALTKGLELCLVGGGPLQGKIKQLVEDLGIGDRVHFLGKRSDIPILLSKADIYVQPSLYEGFGIAALEAMVSGLPVIVSNIPGLGDVVGDAGLKFPRGNVEKLAESLMFLAKDKALRDKLSVLGRKRSLLFSLGDSAKKHFELYKEMLKK